MSGYAGGIVQGPTSSDDSLSIWLSDGCGYAERRTRAEQIRRWGATFLAKFRQFLAPRV